MRTAGQPADSARVKSCSSIHATTKGIDVFCACVAQFISISLTEAPPKTSRIVSPT